MQNLAKFISAFFFPSTWALFGTYFALYKDNNVYFAIGETNYYFFIFVLLYLILPLGLLMVGKKSVKLKVISLPKRESRHIYLFIFAVYFLLIYSFFRGDISPFIEVSLLASSITFCIAFVVNLKVKASLHMMGLLGFIAQMIYFFSMNNHLSTYWLLIFTIFIPIVLWSRLFLKAHTLIETIYGSILGLFINGIVFYLYYGLPSY